METPKFDVVEKTRFYDVTWVAEIPSTNTELLERARRGALEGEVIIADHKPQVEAAEAGLGLPQRARR